MTTSATSDGRNAIIYAAHGSRHPLWLKSLVPLLHDTQKAAPDTLVGIAYVGMGEPTLADLLAQFIAAGAIAVTVVPVFVAPGKHVIEDIPMAVELARASRPDIELVVTSCVGELAGVREAIIAQATGAAGVAED